MGVMERVSLEIEFEVEEEDAEESCCSRWYFLNLISVFILPRRSDSHRSSRRRYSGESVTFVFWSVSVSVSVSV